VDEFKTIEILEVLTKSIDALFTQSERLREFATQLNEDLTRIEKRVKELENDKKTS
jgi:hypothetical protein